MNGYRFEQPLGSGGMAVVYAATHVALERRVAIKVIRPEITYLPVGVARFEREAKVAAALRHPGLLQVFDYGRLPDNRPYLVMRLLEGRTLRDATRQDRRWPLQRIAEALSPVAEALDAMHAQGLVHRDVKPDNIFLEEVDGTEKAIVMDFGLATLFQDTHQLTQQGMLLGTPTYLPPEASERDTREPAADVYALAVTLFELLVGRPPFRDRDAVRLMARRLVSDAPAASSLLSNVPPAVDRFFERALSRKPSKRFQSCGELLAEFRKLDAPLGVPLTTAPSDDELTPQPSETLPELPMPAWPGNAARLAMLIGVLTIGLWIMRLPPFHGRTPETERVAARVPADDPNPDPTTEAPEPESQPAPTVAPTVTDAGVEEAPTDPAPTRRRRRPRPETTQTMETAATMETVTETMASETVPPPDRPDPSVDVQELLSRGRRSLLRGQAVQARNAYRQATGVAPQSVDAWLGLGIASEELGDRLAARRALGRARSLARSPRELQAIDARLARLGE